MPKRKLTDHNWQDDPWLESLASALCLQRNKADMKRFLRDIGTLSELQAWSERLEVAKQLTNNHSYRHVAEITGASTTTITRVAKFLEAGAGGYKKHFKMQEQDTSQLTHLEKLQQRKESHVPIAPVVKTTPQQNVLRKFLS
jgi:TrpR-related protein YerC/YecD